MKEKDKHDLTVENEQKNKSIMEAVPRLDFGASKDRLMRLMEESHLSDKEFSQLLGVSIQAVNKWRNGYGFPDYDSILPLSRILGVTVDDILCSGNEMNNDKRGSFRKGLSADCRNRILLYYVRIENMLLSVELQ